MLLPNELRIAVLLLTFSSSSSAELSQPTRTSSNTELLQTTETSTTTFVQYPSSGTVAPPSFTVPAIGSGSRYASACNTELRLYSNIISGHPPGYGTAITTSRLVTGTAFTANTTTLCDGRPRVWGTITPVSYTTSTQTVIAYTNYTGPPPSCSIRSTDCAQLQSAYMSSLNSYNSYQSAYTTDLPISDLPLKPMCQTPDDADVCGQCTIGGGKVELLYFPVTEDDSRDMCATTATSPTVCPFGETVPATSTATQGYAPCTYRNLTIPRYTGSGSYTIVDDATLYENLAYIAYATLSATNSCGPLGRIYTSGIVPIASTNLYTASGYDFRRYKHGYSLNFADFNPPVPASAYLGQPQCETSGNGDETGIFNADNGDTLNGNRTGFCTPIMDQIYRPFLVVPPEIRGIDPAWQSCLLGLGGLHDPPKALQAVETLDGVSTPGRPGRTGAPATPAPTPYVDAATATSGRTSTATSIAATASFSSSAASPRSGPSFGVFALVLSACTFAGGMGTFLAF